MSGAINFIRFRDVRTEVFDKKKEELVCDIYHKGVNMIISILAFWCVCKETQTSHY